MLKYEAQGVYNLGTGRGVSVEEIAKTVLEITGSTFEPDFTGDFRYGDNRHDFADISKAKRELGFSPKCGIRKGMEKLVEWGEDKDSKDVFDESEYIRKRYFG
jgi:dTDP-L-rhamnose 4-epimerase